MCMLMAHVITCTQFKHDYVDAIDMWDMARRLGWIPWAKVWVKKVWGWGRPLHCETTTKSTPPPRAWFVVLNMKSGASVRREVGLILVRICDAPGFKLVSLTLMTKSAESNLLTLVKPRSTWVITSKTSPTTPIDPLDQVNTHLWSTLGQKHGQTPLKPKCL
jgi:hypothetical protein